MNVLFIVPYVPDPIRVRPYRLVRALHEAGHAVTVATLWSNAAERAAIDDLRALGVDVVAEPLSRMRSLVNCARALPTRSSLQAAFCWQPALAQQVIELARSGRFDVAHVEHLRGAVYGVALRRALPHFPVVWDSVDCISHLFAQAAQHSRSRRGRIMTRLDLARTRRHEAMLVAQFERVLVTSQVDKAALEALVRDFEQPSAPIDVLPNGVALPPLVPRQERAPQTIVFSGKMSYHANISAALHLLQAIMPLVWARRAEVRVQIVGKDPPAELIALGEGDARIEITGTVPEVTSYLERATLAVAPLLYGAGIQNKVLEAMASATPVVADVRATAALQTENGEELLAVEGASAFADAILALLAHEEERKRMGQAGRIYVERHHAWEAAARRLETIYRQTANVAVGEEAPQ